MSYILLTFHLRWQTPTESNVEFYPQKVDGQHEIAMRAAKMCNKGDELFAGYNLSFWTAKEGRPLEAL